jgi:hypothetical protein
MLVRILALAGVLLIGIGAALPTLELGADCGDSLFDVECFDDGVRDGFSASVFGIILILAALVGVYPAAGRRAAGLWVFSLTSVAMVVVLWLSVTARRDLGVAGDPDWGWGVLFGGAGLALLAALLATVRRRPAGL